MGSPPSNDRSPMNEGRVLPRPEEELVDQGLGFDVDTLLSRRRLLAVFGIGAAGLGLAACGVGSSSRHRPRPPRRERGERSRTRPPGPTPGTGRTAPTWVMPGGSARRRPRSRVAARPTPHRPGRAALRLRSGGLSQRIRSDLSAAPSDAPTRGEPGARSDGQHDADDQGHDHQESATSGRTRGYPVSTHPPGGRQRWTWGACRCVPFIRRAFERLPSVLS
jgi:hypothetical protein